MAAIDFLVSKRIPPSLLLLLAAELNLIEHMEVIVETYRVDVNALVERDD